LKFPATEKRSPSERVWLLARSSNAAIGEEVSAADTVLVTMDFPANGGAKTDVETRS
jgi:hypothetical protein